ncbi:Nitroreductase [Xylaria nigripes]|nr:Nitroreductase [Xylaria nigripes]
MLLSGARHTISFSLQKLISPSNLVLKTCSSPTTTSIIRLFSTSLTTPKAVTMAPNSEVLLSAFKARRSIYSLGKNLPISKDKITSIVKESMIQVPSSFNSQSNRALVLYGAEHEKFWDITSSILKGMVPADAWEATAQKMAMFRGGAGTVLCFTDVDVVKSFQEKFAIYRDQFPTWAEHSVAMLQFALWTTLEAEGLGANLQHYNPIVDDRVVKEWGVPKNWKLTAQLVFGAKTGDAGAKDNLPTEQTVKVFGA